MKTIITSTAIGLLGLGIGIALRPFKKFITRLLKGLVIVNLIVVVTYLLQKIALAYPVAAVIIFMFGGAGLYVWNEYELDRLRKL